MSASSFCMPDTIHTRWRIAAAVSRLPSMLIFIGSRRCFLAMRSICLGMVAENSAVWRVAGVCSRIHSTSSMKPMRSISSASSQHHRLQRVQHQRAAAQVVHDAPGGADHDLHAAFQLTDLGGVILAAVDRQHPEVRQVAGVAGEGLGHLDGQLARGREHQDAHARTVAVATATAAPRLRTLQPGQCGQCEGGGLAGTGRCMAEQVAPVEQCGQGLRLDRSGGLVADIGQCPQQRLRQGEIGEGRSGGLWLAHGCGLPAGSRP